MICLPAYLSFFLNGKREGFLDGDSRDIDPDLFSLAIESYGIGRVEESEREREKEYTGVSVTVCTTGV